MSREGLVETGRVAEILPTEVWEWYRQYAATAWKSIDAMVYPGTGLPADQLHYLTAAGEASESTARVDKTSPTNIGFCLACTGGAAAMGFIRESEAARRIDLTLETVETMMEDPEVFIPTDEKKGLFINWIQPSTGQVLEQWPGSDRAVKKQISTIDNAWLMAFGKLVGAQFPEFRNRIGHCLDRMDLPFMLDGHTGFFHGCYGLNPPGFESWQYDVISEARITYLVGDNSMALLLGKLINRRSERSVFVDSSGQKGRATWDGQLFQLGWPNLLVPEDELNPQWGNTFQATVRVQREFGAEHNRGHYGYSAGLSPEGEYYEFRVPQSGENTAPYPFQPVVTISALVNMGLVEPIETYEAVRELHREFPELSHPDTGDGDTVNTETGAIQKDQLLPNQATSLMTCWNIVKEGEPQELFMRVAPAAIRDVYRDCPLW